jgi:hypothetical protein
VWNLEVKLSTLLVEENEPDGNDVRPPDAERAKRVSRSDTGTVETGLEPGRSRSTH